MKSSSSNIFGLFLLAFGILVIALAQTVCWVLFALVPPIYLIGVLNSHFGQDGLVTDAELLVTFFVSLGLGGCWVYFVTKLQNTAAKAFEEGFKEISKEIIKASEKK